MAREWDESRHPRVPRHNPEGGQFTDDPAGWAFRVAAGAAESAYSEIDYGDVDVNGQAMTGESDLALPRSSLSRIAKDATLMWCDDSVCQALTRGLRAGRDLDAESVPHPLDSSIPFSLGKFRDDLDRAIQQGVLRRNAQLWRGLILRHGEASRLFPVGAEVHDEAPAAMSMDRAKAEQMLTHRRRNASTPGEPWLMKILAPEGTHVAPGSYDVKELIGPRKMKTRVLRVTEPTVNDPGEIVLEVVQ